MSRRAQKNVGIIGLGIIGRRVADCLRRRGFHVFVWNRTPRPYPNFVGSSGEIAELCDLIQIFVSNDEALLQVIQQMKSSLKAHHVVMVHCTVSPSTVREAAEIVKRRGAQLLDAPFTGSKGAAEKGELVYYLAGDDAAYRRARPVLDASSKEIIEIGEVGQAMTIKVATNMITAATVQITAEALALVDHAGIPLEKFANAMKSNGSNSGTLAMKLPKMMNGDFETQFSVKHMLKDVEIAARLGRAYGLRLGVTEVAREGLIEEAERGGADSDYSAVVRSYFPEPTPEHEEEAIQQELPEPPEPERQPAVVAVVPEPEPERIVERALEPTPEPKAEPEAKREEEVSRNGSDEMSEPMESRVVPVEEIRKPEVEEEAAPVEARTEVEEAKEPELEIDRQEDDEREEEAKQEVKEPNDREREIDRDEEDEREEKIEAKREVEEDAAPAEAKIEREEPKGREVEIDRGEEDEREERIEAKREVEAEPEREVEDEREDRRREELIEEEKRDDEPEPEEAEEEEPVRVEEEEEIAAVEPAKPIEEERAEPVAVNKREADSLREEAIEEEKRDVEAEPEETEDEPVRAEEEEEEEIAVVEAAKPMPVEEERAKPVAVAAAAKKEEEEEAAPRGFFSRFFGRGTDY